VLKSKISPARPKIILFGAVIVLLGAFLYLGRVDPNELSVLKKFPYTVEHVQIPEDGTTTYRYVLQADPTAVLAELPHSRDKQATVGAKGQVYEFRLPSGRSGRFLGSANRKDCVIMVEGKADPMAVRALRRIGFM
jgi:hypothetical protein